MIKIENLSYGFPQKDLYDNISFTIDQGEHCGFIGTSGSGKTTLAEIIMDPEKYMFDGLLHIDEGCRIGHISQFYKHSKTDTTTVFQYISQDYIDLQNKMTNICSEMETSTDLEPLLVTYQETFDAIQAIGGDDFESTVDKKLNLANLSHLRDMTIADLSGGEFKLIQILKEMLHSPELIIMDEPDVFLDFDNLNSLKNLINDYKEMLLVITHNRYLLNHCFNKIIHLENMQLQEFEGNYVDYNFSLLQTKIETQELAVCDDIEIERNEALIDKLRFISSYNSDSSRGNALGARVKIQERLTQRRIKSPFVNIKKPDIVLTTDNEIEDQIALTLTNYEISFDDLLLHNVNFEIGSKDKVAIIGPNGTGKTTLLKEIYQNSNPAIKLNDSVEMAYLSQVQDEMLKESNTVLDEFFDLGFKTNQSIIDYVSTYGFKEEYVHQKISSLSGGERNILQLAKISFGKANLLLLDEPTSHLDTYSQIALEEAITEYNGGVLIVSHDFYTVVNCADYVLLIEDKKIRKMTMRKFRKMIYTHHFDKDYLELEQKKKEIETKIELALKKVDFESAKTLSLDLEQIVEKIDLHN